MTRTIDFALDASGFDRMSDTVDGLPLVARFNGEPTIQTWLTRLWGISPGHRSLMGGLATPQVGGSASPWLYSI